jgi:hypothetical protein
MIYIVGDGQFPECKAFYDVKAWLQGKINGDVYLAAMLAPLVGLHLEGVVIYNLEPLYDGCRSFTLGYLDTLKRCTVLDYSRKNVEYLKTLGVKATYVPYPFHNELVRPVPDVVKDIDVLLVGSKNTRRLEAVKNLPDGVRFVWAEGVYGRELDVLIQRAKVHLNIHFATPHPLEVVRLNYLIANGCTVLSEEGDDEEVNAEYAHFLTFFSPEDLASVVLKALATFSD